MNHDNIVHASRAEIASVQEANFAETMDLVFEGHPFYRKVLETASLTRADFQSLADLAKLPVTTKQHYIQDPESFRLRVDNLPPEMTVTWDVMYTTGTSSGKPTPFYTTSYDFYNILSLNRGMLQIRRVRETDLIANLSPLTVYPIGAYNRTLHAASVMNIPVVAPLPGNPSPYFKWGNGVEEVVRIIERCRATILWGYSSYVRRVIMRAHEMGADFSPVRMVFAAGEPTPDGMRREIIARLESLGAREPWVSISYGMTEMQGGLVECAHDSGYHNPAPDQFYFEIVDPETHEAKRDGEEGLILLTHLNRRGTVLLRYAIGDITSRTTETCPDCGANTDRMMQIPRRADGMFKVKGQLVNPDLLADILAAENEMEEYQVVLTKEDPEDRYSMDVMVIKIAARDGAREGLRGRVAGEVKKAVGVTPRIEFVGKNEIFDPDRSLKSKRILDLRPKD